jgi:hypothetical protein
MGCLLDGNGGKEWVGAGQRAASANLVGLPKPPSFPTRRYSHIFQIAVTRMQVRSLIASVLPGKASSAEK